MESFLAEMNNSYRAEKFPGSNRDRHQPALRRLVLHDARRHDADPRTVRHSFLDHLQIVEVKRDVDANMMVSKEAIDIPAYGQVLIETDEIYTIQILRTHFRFVCQRVIRRCSQHHFLIAPWPHRD